MTAGSLPFAGTSGTLAGVECGMEDLVLCPCGHAMGAHGGDGCSGERSRICACTLDRFAALDAAVNDARARPWVPAGGASAS